MSPIEATVRLIEGLNMTGKLADLNVGQVYDLSEQWFALFNQKPTNRPKAREKAAHPLETATSMHVKMADPNIQAQAPLDPPFRVKMADPDTMKVFD